MNENTSLDFSLNPFAQPSKLSYEFPDFSKIRDEHYLPAFEIGMTQGLRELDEIANNPAPPTFENTLEALERSGELLQRVSSVFFELAGSQTNDTLQAIERDIAPKLSAFSDSIVMNEKVFTRLKAVYDTRNSLSLSPEQLRLVERYFQNWARAGALLSSKDKEKLKAINEKIATLQTTFVQNVRAESNESAIIVNSAEELAGLGDGEIKDAQQLAERFGHSGKYALAIVNTTTQPVLKSLENETLRKRIFETSSMRGTRGGKYDNRAVITELASLRAQHAQLLGYENHASYVAKDAVAGSVSEISTFLKELSAPAVAVVLRDRAERISMKTSVGKDSKLNPWDWELYSEKLREKAYAFNEAELKPYFEFKRVLHDGVFFSVNRLFGVTFTPRTDLTLPNPDCLLFEVREEDGSPLALFMIDPYARPSKRGGAWMNCFVNQSKLLNKKPVITNCLNIPKPSDGNPTLMTLYEVNTLFHEIGHMLHGLFSAGVYPLLCGLAVPRDFVEFPSQLYEMWALWPEVLKNYARHYQTGELLPAKLLEKIASAKAFNQGYLTTEYLAATVIDQAWHTLSPTNMPTDVLAFEKQSLEKYGLDIPEVPPRYHSTYFQHSFSGGYSASYYAYLWSEVLSASGTEWFKKNGGLTRKNGDHLRKTVLSKGNTESAKVLFEKFFGGPPRLEALLRQRGLTAEPGK